MVFFTLFRCSCGWLFRCIFLLRWTGCRVYIYDVCLDLRLAGVCIPGGVVGAKGETRLEKEAGKGEACSAAFTHLLDKGKALWVGFVALQVCFS